MTKNELQSLHIGDKVYMTIPDIQTAFMVTLVGTVIRINFNGSQVLVKWKTGSEIWHGRTSIEKI